MKILLRSVLATTLAVAALQPQAAFGAADTMQIQVDGAALVAEVAPDLQQGRAMVPLRLIGEQLGAEIQWAEGVVTLQQAGQQVVLQPNLAEAHINGEKQRLEVAPYLKQDRLMVPLRLIAETFNCTVEYTNRTVYIVTQPLQIKQTPVKALQYEYRMTMGGVVQQIQAGIYNRLLYAALKPAEDAATSEPDDYSWHAHLDVPGSYTKWWQFDFLAEDDSSLLRYDVYGLTRGFPEELLVDFPGVLVHDTNADAWYILDEARAETIRALLLQADEQGLVELIENTVV